MSLTLVAEAVAIDKLIGIYTDIKNTKNKKELFKKDNDLWLKNEVFGENYRYIGNNTFKYPGEPAGSHASLQFELLSSGDIKLTISTLFYEPKIISNNFNIRCVGKDSKSCGGIFKRQIRLSC